MESGVHLCRDGEELSWVVESQLFHHSTVLFLPFLASLLLGSSFSVFCSLVHHSLFFVPCFIILCFLFPVPFPCSTVHRCWVGHCSQGTRRSISFSACSEPSVIPAFIHHSSIIHPCITPSFIPAFLRHSFINHPCIPPSFTPALQHYLFNCHHPSSLLHPPLPPSLLHPPPPLSLPHPGTPSEATWPGVSKLPDYKLTFPKWRPQNLSHILWPNMDADALSLLEVVWCAVIWRVVV